MYQLEYATRLSEEVEFLKIEFRRSRLTTFELASIAHLSPITVRALLEGVTKKPQDCTLGSLFSALGFRYSRIPTPAPCEQEEPWVRS